MSFAYSGFYAYLSRCQCICQVLIFGWSKKKVWFYIALYPVRWPAQSALHFPPLADLFIPTPFSASLGSILVHRQAEFYLLSTILKGISCMEGCSNPLQLWAPPKSSDMAHRSSISLWTFLYIIRDCQTSLLIDQFVSVRV